MRKGFEEEKAFWAEFVQKERFRANWASDTINPELHPDVVDLLAAEVGIRGACKVADIGSGAESILRGVEGLEITKADPLGWYYAELGCSGVVTANGENLPHDVFKTGYFDVAHIRNAIDHSESPIQVFAELLRTTRPGGLVIVQGFENEALFENHAGLHQFDVSVTSSFGAELKCMGRESFTYRCPAIIAKTYTLVTGRRWFVFALRKPDNE